MLLLPLQAQRGAEILLAAARPDSHSRDPRAIYLQDHLRPDQRVILEVSQDAALFRTSQADMMLGQVSPGLAAELLAFTEHGVFVRVPDGLGGNMQLGWLGRNQVKGPEPAFLTALQELERRRAVVEELIEQKQVAIGMTPAEVERSLGQPTEEQIRESAEGVAGRLSWVETRRIPQMQTFRNPHTGQIEYRIVGYQIIEEGRVDVEFANGSVTAIERTRDRRRAREIPNVPLPVVIPAW